MKPPIGAIDLLTAIKQHELWRSLAWYKIKQSNSRTKLGVLWHPLSFLITVGVLGYMYSTFFGREIDVYVPYLASGFVAWRFILAMVTEGVLSVTSGRSLLTQRAMPVSIFPLKLVCSHVYLFGFHLLAFVTILAIYRIFVLPNVLLLIVGFSIVIVAGVATTLLLGVAAVFQRWIQNLIPPVMNLTFFITPILWMPNMLVGGDAAHFSLDLSQGISGRSALMLANPFYYFLEIIRGPLLGYSIPAFIWITAITLTIIMMLLALTLLSHTKSRVLLHL